jgi:mannosyltransferase PIG-V
MTASASRRDAAEDRGFWTLVAIRLAYWLVVATALLWAPARGNALSPARVGGSLGDLFFGAFAHWDATWFAHIAEHGYDSKQSTAFFPLYPLIVRELAHVVQSTYVAGTIVSLVAGGIGVAVVHRIARMFLSSEGAWDTVLLIALYPLAFVFTAAYSDGLFLALTAGSFLAALRNRPLAAGALGGLAVGTRLVGVALFPALAVLLWPRPFSRRGLLRLAPLACLPLALVLYAVYLHVHLHDAGAFLHAEDVFWNRHTPALGPLAGLWDAVKSAYQGAAEIARHLPRASGSPGGFPHRDQWAAWNVVQFLLLVAAIWLTVVAWRRLGAAFGLYSAATIVIFLSGPAAVVPLVSVPRFLLADFPLFIALAGCTERRPRLRLTLLCSFAAIGALAAVAFSRNVWVA